MNEIEPGLFVGNLDDALAAAKLEAHGVRSILTLNDFPSRPRPGFDWLCVPMRDGPGNPPSLFAEAVASAALLRERSGALLLHCMEGKSRSVVIAALHLSSRSGSTPAEALERVQLGRPVAAPDPVLWAQALAFHASQGSDRPDSPRRSRCP